MSTQAGGICSPPGLFPEGNNPVFPSEVRPEASLVVFAVLLNVCFQTGKWWRNILLCAGVNNRPRAGDA